MKPVKVYVSRAGRNPAVHCLPPDALPLQSSHHARHRSTQILLSQRVLLWISIGAMSASRRISWGWSLLLFCFVFKCTNTKCGLFVIIPPFSYHSKVLASKTHQKPSQNIFIEEHTEEIKSLWSKLSVFPGMSLRQAALPLLRNVEYCVFGSWQICHEKPSFICPAGLPKVHFWLLRNRGVLRLLQICGMSFSEERRADTSLLA